MSVFQKSCLRSFRHLTWVKGAALAFCILAAFYPLSARGFFFDNNSDEVAMANGVRSAQKWEAIIANHDDDKRLQSYVRLGHLAWKEGHFLKAEKFFRSARALFPQSTMPIFALGHLKFVQGNYHEAATHLLEAWNQSPAASYPHFDVAGFFAKPQDYYETQKHLSALMKQNPQAQEFPFLLTYLYYNAGENKKARQFATDTKWQPPYAGQMQSLLAQLTPLSPKTAQKVRSSRSKIARRAASPLRLATFNENHREMINTWYPTIQAISERYGVDPKLVAAVIFVESRFNPNAVSPAGACGIMQLIPGTAERFGVQNIYDPQENISAGVRYLRFLLDTFGSVQLAVAGYNAGERNVRQFGGIPPFYETRVYVRNVLQAYQRL